MTAASDLFRSARDLRTGRFAPAHPALDAPPEQRGAGVLTGTWIACEEPGAEQGCLRSGLELVHSARAGADGARIIVIAARVGR